MPIHDRVIVSGMVEHARPPCLASFILDPRKPVSVPGPQPGTAELVFAHREKVNSYSQSWRTGNTILSYVMSVSKLLGT